MKSKEKDGTRIVNLILNLIIVVLCFAFVITAGVMIGEFYQALTPTYSSDNFHYKIEAEQYYDMVGAYHGNTQAGFEGDKDMQECYGVTKYFEAASLYHAYQVAGNEEMVAFFAKKMEQAEKEMGGWSITKEPILKYLGIEKE